MIRISLITINEDYKFIGVNIGFIYLEIFLFKKLNQRWQNEKEKSRYILFILLVVRVIQMREKYIKYVVRCVVIVIATPFLLPMFILAWVTDNDLEFKDYFNMFDKVKPWNIMLIEKDCVLVV